MSETPPRVQLRIERQRFEHWQTVEIERSIDSYSTVKFDAPFEPEAKEFRDLFRPFSYKAIEVFVDDGAIFTGTLVEVEPDQDPNSTHVGVSCYARPAVMHDCDAPKDAYPLEFNGMDILQIAQQICGAFGFTASVDQGSIERDGSTIDAEFIKKAQKRGRRGGLIGGKGSKFARLELHPGDNPQDFLAGLAKQRGVVMTDDPAGNLLLWNSVFTGSPVARLEVGRPPVIKVTPSFNPQGYYSEMTAWTPSTRHKLGIDYTQPNPLAPAGVIRPHSFKPDDTDSGDAPTAAKAKMARMFGNMVSWEVELPTWRDPQGNLFQPNTTVTLKAPRAMIYKETELLVRTVVMKQSAEAFSSKLTLVLPGAFSAEFPETFPWD